MAFDLSDASWNTIVVGIGSQSSDGRLGGLHMGVLRTTDGGKTWTNLGATALYGYRMAGIAAYGSTISVCAVGYGLLSSQLYQNGATFHSTDTGATWVQNNAESCTDMTVEPKTRTIFRASLQNGIVSSNDDGITWSPQLYPNFPNHFTQQIKNIRIAVRNQGTAANPDITIFAGFLSKTLQELARGSQTNTPGLWAWTELDTPSTNDNGTINGLNPVFENNPGEGGNGDNHHYKKPGGQGTIHFSIVADVMNPHVVYVGGDRQPTGGNATDPSWPNSIGAYNYDGRLFRCDSTRLPGTQCTPLTHMYASNNSAPHADSRDMMFDASGRIIESDDGGVYFRTNPIDTTGGWGSLLGNLQVQEAQGAAYLGNGYFATGNQDTGTTYGLGGSPTEVWQSLGQGDGGVPRSGVFQNNTRVLYWSYPFFGGFSATTFSAGQELLGTENPALLIAGSNNSLQAWVSGPPPPVSFYQNYAVNSQNPSRLLFVFNLNGFAYESFDGGNTLQQITIAPGLTGQNGNGASVYGGILDGVQHESLTYAAGLDQLARRDFTGKWTVTNWPPVGIRWPTIADVAADPTNFNHVAVLGIYGEVAFSKDGGNTWTIVAPLQLGVWGMPDSQQRKIVVIPHGNTPRIVIAGRTGMYVLQQENAKWWRINGWPNAYVNDMGYDAQDDLLWISTLGRSVWKVENASKVFTEDGFVQATPPYVRPPKVPNWVTLTYVFAALTVILFLTTMVFGVAYLTTKLKDNSPSDHQPLMSEDA
jgi:hypothetical protein